MAGTSKKVNVFDENFEKTVLEWYNEIDEENSDIEPDESILIDSDHESESEQELSDSDDPEYNVEGEYNLESDNETEDLIDNTPTLNANNDQRKKKENFWFGKNRFKWSKAEPTRNVRTPARNMVILPRTRLIVNDSKDSLEFFNKLFSDEMYNLIVTWTNKKLDSMRLRYQRPNKPELSKLTVTELRAFIGLLLYTAIFKSNNEDVRSIFARDGTGRDIFRTVMSVERFSILLVALRFDNPETRENRKKSDVGAAISDLFDLFIKNTKAAYSVGSHACVDEMLVGFRGRCSFKMYIPSKPEKYGIKIMALTDAKTSYLFNAYIYKGKNSDGHGLAEKEKKLGKPLQAVIRLAHPLYNSNRNITCDNWFTSVELVENLLKHNLTCVGTLKKNKREIPPEFLPTKGRKVGETCYGFTKNLTLLSHTPKKNKAVILVSSMHHTMATDPNDKPEIINFYNSTKGGVDSMDEKCAKYTCSRRTRRWPMAIFYKIVDICSTNSYIMYNSFPGNDSKRFKFVKTLAGKLIEEHVRERLHSPFVTRELKVLSCRFLDIPYDPPPQEEVLEIRKYCYVCPSKIRRKTKYLCEKCHRPICLQCSRKCCINCCSNDENQ